MPAISGIKAGDVVFRELAWPRNESSLDFPVVVLRIVVWVVVGGVVGVVFWIVIGVVIDVVAGFVVGVVFGVVFRAVFVVWVVVAVDVGVVVRVVVVLCVVVPVVALAGVFVGDGMVGVGVVDEGGFEVELVAGDGDGKGETLAVQL